MKQNDGPFYIMRVWFKDGQQRSFRSWDRKNRHYKTKDQHIGLYRLLKYLRKVESKVESACIYDNRNNPNGELIYKLAKGSILVDKTV